VGMGGKVVGEVGSLGSCQPLLLKLRKTMKELKLVPMALSNSLLWFIVSKFGTRAQGAFPSPSSASSWYCRRGRGRARAKGRNR